MRVLVACEREGRVRDAFRALGHDAWSCDLEPDADDSAYHVQADVAELLELAWDLVIAFPPCTALCSSGSLWWPGKRASGAQAAAVDFFLQFTRLECAWAIENPVGLMSSIYGKPNQIIQPWQYGHGETKATCLWLNGLPNLKPTDIVEGREPRVHRMAPGPERARLRSATYPNVALAMSSQWGGITPGLHVPPTQGELFQ